jgi:dienelactone hydrolase
MKPIAIITALVVATAITAGTAAAADARKSDVDIKAPDGTNLKATYFAPSQPGPAMLLLHQCNMDRHAWDGLAADLAAAGIHVLTLDYRGYGESGGKPADDAERRVLAQKWPDDIDAAYAFLLSQKGVDKTRVAAGGASCGVTQSSNLAARHHEIRALMLLSGSVTDATREYIAKTPALAVFGAATENDGSAAKNIGAAVGASLNPGSMAKIYAGNEHGVPMFPKNPALEPMIVNWLKTQLSSKAGTQ